MKKLLIAWAVFFAAIMIYTMAEARFNRAILAKNAQYFNDVCLEIGRTAVIPRVCKSPTKVMYKGLYCFGCPEASRCNPGCRGGKICVNQKCMCPPNRMLVDCNGRCQSPTVPCVLE